MKHDWVPITRYQHPPRMRCSRCGMVRRYSMVMDGYAYYHPGFIGGRPGPCRAGERQSPARGEK